MLKHFFKPESEKFRARHKKDVALIESLEPEMTKLSNIELRNKTDEFKSRLHAGESLDDLMIEAYAVCREASKRTLNMRHFPVQLLGGIALHKGKVAEMKTGEGKTLVATLPTYLNALDGKGVHIVTVNDYLTKRDYDLNKPLFDFLGLSSGYVTQDMSASEKRDAYHQDVTYVVNTQLGFDYLNDNRMMKAENCLQRGLPYCIIDEVDSILLDEARTPLIISQSDADVSHWVPIVDILVKKLEKEDYQVEEKTQSGSLTESGIEKMERILDIDNLMDDQHIELNYTIRQALIANYVLRKDKHYLVTEDQVELIDENTGRVTKGRRYSNGLHQALEAKEGVTIQKESVTLASITYQYLFGYYDKISGMTGTAITEEEEFWDVYRLEVVLIPTNKPIKRIDHPDRVYATQDKKLEGIVKDVKASHDLGQPVLIGVSTIAQSEQVSYALTEANIAHHVLNAKNHKLEASIIASAGQKGAVTVATNMAGRGTDIKLGEGVIDLGGLKIIGTERNMNRRVDNQLRGRAGRQGDIGESRFHVSLDDEMMQVFATDKMKQIIETMGATAGNKDGVIENRFLSGFIERTQSGLEGQHYDSRKETIEFDGVMNAQRELIYAERKDILTGKVSIAALMRGQTDGLVEVILNKAFDHVDVLSTEAFTTLVSQLHETFTKAFEDDSLYLSTLTRGQEKTRPAVQETITTPLKELVEARLYAFEGSNEHHQYQVKSGLLSIIDHHWRQHLIDVDEIKNGIHLVTYVGENPLEAYLFQTNTAFNAMVHAIKLDMLKYFLNTEWLNASLTA